MDLLSTLASKAVSMIADALVALARRLRSRIEPDPRQLQFDTLYADLNEPARIALWYLCDSSLLPHVLAERLRDARLEVNVDEVLKELAEAGLIGHDFSGDRYVNPEWVPYVRETMRRRR